MKIIIELAETVSAAAEARIKKMAGVAESHDVDFNDDCIVVQRGDFTTILIGDGHHAAGALFELVQRLAHGEDFATDDEGFLLVPFPGGGVAKIRQRGRPPGPVVGSMTARVEIRMTPAQREKLETLGGAAWLRDRIDKAKP